MTVISLVKSYIDTRRRYIRVHDIAHKSSGVTAADNDPRRLTRRDLIPIRLRELDVLGKICEVLDCLDRKSTRLNSSHSGESRMPSSA